jgi:glucokinase
MLLAGDIGGTKTALAVFDPQRGPREPIAEKIFPSGDYPSLESITREYLAEIDLPVTHACFAVAGPVGNGKASLTNLPWLVDESALEAALSIESVVLLNDVQAMTTAIPHLDATDVRTLRDGEPEPGGAIALIAPGTGLGEAFLVWDGSRYRAYPSEGGHSNFGPTTARESDLLKYMQARWSRVSYERVCAGQSIPDLYDFLNGEGLRSESSELRAELATVRDRTPTIMAAALDPDHPDPLCLATMQMFASILGAEAGNLALTVLATGGVYIAGGIPQRILPRATRQALILNSFLATFQEKGRLTPLMSRIPVYIIVEPRALVGTAVHGLELMDPAERVSA